MGRTENAVKSISNVPVTRNTVKLVDPVIISLTQIYHLSGHRGGSIPPKDTMPPTTFAEHPQENGSFALEFGKGLIWLFGEAALRTASVSLAHLDSVGTEWKGASEYRRRVREYSNEGSANLNAWLNDERSKPALQAIGRIVLATITTVLLGTAFGINNAPAH